MIYDTDAREVTRYVKGRYGNEPERLVRTHNGVVVPDFVERPGTVQNFLFSPPDFLRVAQEPYNVEYERQRSVEVDRAINVGTV